jgi:hypothetical protein
MFSRFKTLIDFCWLFARRFHLLSSGLPAAHYPSIIPIGIILSEEYLKHLIFHKPAYSNSEAVCLLETYLTPNTILPDYHQSLFAIPRTNNSRNNHAGSLLDKIGQEQKSIRHSLDTDYDVSRLSAIAVNGALLDIAQKSLVGGKKPDEVINLLDRYVTNLSALIVEKKEELKTD